MPNLRDLQREVHLWFLPTRKFCDLELANQAASVLSQAEKDRAARFAFEKDRRTYTAAHWLLRSVLSEYLPVAPADWRFQGALLGKPAIVEPREGIPLQFNLSHSAGMVACAVSLAGEVGVDVETIRPQNSLELARRFFAPDEASQLETLTPDLQTEAFFRLWTLKEAYIKARGLGLSLDLAGFAFPDVLGEEITIRFAEGFEDDPADWRFFRHEPDCAHKIAVAVHVPAGTEVSLKVFPDFPAGGFVGTALQ
jgi:4'-phosphopantetheinyl transferase